MPMYQITKDMVEQLNQSFTDKKEEHQILFDKSIEDIWLNDLQILDKEVAKHLLKSISIDDTVVKNSKQRKTTKKTTKKR